VLALLALACAQAPAPSGPTLLDAAPSRPVATLTDTGEAPAVSWPVCLNELMAKNDSTVQDEVGEQDDWVELAMTGDAPTADLSGWGLGYEPDQGPTWTFPAGTSLAQGQHTLVWLDGQADQGALHADLSLLASGDSLTLFGPPEDSSPVVDTWSFGAQTGDVSLGHFPDCGSRRAPTVQPTPGNANPWDPGMETDPSQALFRRDRALRFAPVPAA